MSPKLPEVEDYLRLFQIYGKDLGSIYQETSVNDPYEFLFQQIILMLIKPSEFNLSLPKPFRTAAHRYHRGDLDALEHLNNLDNRHFMLCDLHDLIMLRGGLSLKRRQSEKQ